MAIVNARTQTSLEDVFSLSQASWKTQVSSQPNLECKCQ